MPHQENPPLDSLLEHRPWVRAVARRLLRDEHAAEDLAQETWTRALRSPPDPERDPKPWLRRVLKNAASNMRRGDARRNQRETAWREQREQRSPAALVAEAEQHKRLVGHVLDLEEPFKTALVLRFYEGLGPKEIAERLDVPVGTVHSRIARAVERLKERLDSEEQGDRKAWIAAFLPLTGLERFAPAAAAGATTTSFLGILIMTLTKPNVALLAVLLLGSLVGGALWLAGDSDSEPTQDGIALEAAREAGPELETRGTQLAAKAPDAPAPTTPDVARTTPGTTWHGRVLDTHGKPVADALVFALPHGARGVAEEGLADKRLGTTRTKADGTFRATVGEMDRPRLIAWSETHMAVSTPLSGRDSGAALELRLGAARELRLRVDHAITRGMTDMLLRIRTRGENFEHTDDPSVQACFVLEDHPDAETGEEFVVRVNTTAPLHAQVEPPRGYATVPNLHVFEAADRRTSFRVVSSATISYSLLDDATGKPLGQDVRTTLYLHDVASGAIVASQSTGNPSFELTSGLAPGRYRYEFQAKGYAKIEREIEITEPGQQVRGTLRMQPVVEEDVGQLLLRLRLGTKPSMTLLALATKAVTERSELAHVVLTRRHGETAWKDTDCATLADGRLTVRPAIWEMTKPPFADGVYDIYVAQRGTGLAALLRGVRVFEGQANELDVTLEPGTFLGLRSVAGADDALTSVEVRMADVGVLPWVEFRRNGWGTFCAPREFGRALETPREDRLLGPFPAGEVQVIVTPKEGKAKTLRVRGANEIQR